MVTIFKILPVITQMRELGTLQKRPFYLCSIILFCGVVFIDTQTRVQERTTGQYKAEVYFDSYYDITYADIEAMEWVRNNTPSEAKFVVLARDQTLEWLPFIAQRTVINTPYGSEWEPLEAQMILQLNVLLKSCYDTPCFYENILEFSEYEGMYFYIDQYRIEKFSGKFYYKKDNMIVLWKNNEAVIGYLTVP